MRFFKKTNSFQCGKGFFCLAGAVLCKLYYKAKESSKCAPKHTAKEKENLIF